MALADKNIVITPNKGQTADPKIAFTAASAGSSSTITLNVYTNTNGTLSFEGSAGQLFSISNSFTGTIFSVNDVSGIPSIEVLDTGQIKLAQYNGYVSILGTTNATSTASGVLQVSGGVGIGGNLYVGGTIFGLASVSGTISTATSLAGGALGQIPYQTASGVTQFIGAGTTGSVLRMGATTASFVSTTTLQVGYSVHLLGGSAGSLPYQSAPNATTFLSISGSNGFVLTSNGTGPQWSAASGITTGISSQVNTAAQTTNTSHFLTFVDSNNAAAAAESVYTTSSFSINPSTGVVQIAGTAASTSTNTGALQVAGGVGIGGALWVGTDSSINGLTVGRGKYNDSSNTAIGASALLNNAAAFNTAVGAGAGQSNTTGQQNTYIGSYVAANSTASSYNVAIGSYALGFSVPPAYGANTAIGSNAGSYVTGTSNTYIGSDAARYVSSGNSNIAIGSAAMGGGSPSSLKSGSDNIAIGTNTLNLINGATQNIAIGTGAANGLTSGSDNSLVGYRAGYAITTGAYNVAFGTQALTALTTQSFNSAFGYRALYSNTSGTANTAIGSSAGYGITTAQYSVGIGFEALLGNTTVTGDYNTAVGAESIRLITSGTRNTGVGYRSLSQVSAQSYNTAVGAYSQVNNYGGSYNTSLGDISLYAVTTGSYNIAIGYQAGNSITTGTSNTIIGSVSGTAAMTGTVIVAAGTAERFRIDSVGNMGIGTTTPSALLDVNGTVGVRSATNATSSSTGALQVTGGAGIGGDLWVGGTAYATVLQATSDVNFKKDITTITGALNTVMQLRGVEYKWKHNDEPGLGLIAQEVQPLVPAAVAETSDRLTVSYGNMVGLLVEAIKEQQQQILALQQEIRDLKR